MIFQSSFHGWYSTAKVVVQMLKHRMNIILIGLILCFLSPEFLVPVDCFEFALLNILLFMTEQKKGCPKSHWYSHPELASGSKQAGDHIPK